MIAKNNQSAAAAQAAVAIKLADLLPRQNVPGGAAPPRIVFGTVRPDQAPHRPKTT
jgi:hypothetical protein